MQLWEIEAHPGLEIQGRFQRDENGHEVWVLVAKRAWKRINKAWVEQENPPIYDNPLYTGEEGFSALKQDQEFQIHKNKTDVIVHGKARTYAKKPTKEHQCRLLIEGHIDKTIRVSGPRRWIEYAGTLSASEPQTFIETDIDYSWAMGGAQNSVGCGVAETNKELLTQGVPCVFYPKEDWSPKSQNVRVAGFGAVPPFFLSRVKWAGTFDKEWELERKPLLPVDFKRDFFQSAPEDQQCKGYLCGNEQIMVSGLNHDEAFLFKVPKEAYKAQIQVGEVLYQAPMNIYTLYLDADTEFLSISYGVSFPCQGQEHRLIKSTISLL